MALAKLNHSNIEMVYEFGSQDGVDFLVMEYVAGKTLTEKLTEGPVLEKELVSLATQIVEAVEEAHDRGIVHRDLKPSNILITAKGQAKVLDFGLAKWLRAGEELTADQVSDTLSTAGTLPASTQLLTIPVTSSVPTLSTPRIENRAVAARARAAARGASRPRRC